MVRKWVRHEPQRKCLLRGNRRIQVSRCTRLTLPCRQRGQTSPCSIFAMLKIVFCFPFSVFYFKINTDDYPAPAD